MSSLPFHLDPISIAQYVITGNVVLGNGVAIAPGVLLQADPGSRILLGAGVCLGMGCVIHASGGDIAIGHGANLGAGVLVVGATTIGDRALVGAGTTVYGRSIEPGAMIAPSSLWVSEQAVPNAQTENIAPPENNPSCDLSDRVKVDANNGFFYTKANGKVKPVETPIADPWDEPAITSQPTLTEIPAGTPGTGSPVVSTYVYPEDGTQPKHAWEINANTDLGLASPQPTAGTTASNSSFYPAYPPIVNPTQNSAYSPQPNPDSDLSAAEMQYSAGNGNQPQSGQPQSGQLAPRDSKQVYGQAYVNQMLGKMLGK